MLHYPQFIELGSSLSHSQPTTCP